MFYFKQNFILEEMSMWYREEFKYDIHMSEKAIICKRKADIQLKHSLETKTREEFRMFKVLRKKFSLTVDE